ncbi:MAG: hypothetical protein CMO01_00005, partial [Thalassobius sp.]|nr:hypothetical protein [Thalassovita sp.]
MKMKSNYTSQMIKKYLLIAILTLTYQTAFCQDQTINFNTFEVYAEKQVSAIAFNPEGSSLDSIAAYLLAKDIETLTSQKPQIITDLTQIKSNCILIGELNSTFIKEVLKGEMPKSDFHLQ